MTDITDEQIDAVFLSLDDASLLELSDTTIYRFARAVLALQPSASAVPVQAPLAEACSLCNGRGFYGTPGKRCELCDGTGRWGRPPPPVTAAREQEGRWKDAVDDALVRSGLDCLGPDEDPYKAVARLIEWEVTCSLDPAVSQRAADLVERGKAEASATGAEPAADEYGATDFGYTFAGIQLTDGAKRLMAMLVRAFGTDHPAVADMTAIAFNGARATPTTVQAEEPVDVEQMLRDCVPGGSSCDPQTIADGLRAWFARNAS